MTSARSAPPSSGGKIRSRGLTGANIPALLQREMLSTTDHGFSSTEEGLATYRRIVEDLHIGVCVWRLEQDDIPASLRLMVANVAACRFLGVTREQVLGRSIHEGFPGSEAAPLPAIFTELAMRGGSRDLGVVPYVDDIVSQGMFAIHAAAIAPRIVCVQFMNVTEQKRLEALKEVNEELVRRLSAQAEETRREAERSLAQVIGELEQKLDIIAQQNTRIHALSAPILDVWEGVLAVPIIGEFNSARASDLTASLLDAVVVRRARAVILDVTGISALDQESAGHLGRLITAVRLLGAEGAVTGIRPQLAQTLTELGQDAIHLRTFRSLSDGLRACVGRLLSPGKQREGRGNIDSLHALSLGRSTTPPRRGIVRMIK
jgi:anti-anti-sigma regulatory factor/PAS domain-containing protein